MNSTDVKKIPGILRSVSLPDWFTAARILLVPVVLALLSSPSTSVGIAFTVFLIAALTDVFDGYFARRLGVESGAGKLLDPIADKMLIILPLILLAAHGRAPAGLVVVIAARDLVVCGFRLIAAERGFTIAAGILGKIKTVAQMAILGAYLLNIGVFGWIVTTVEGLTVISAIEYLYTNRQLFTAKK